ncbi:YdhR family protein [Serratia plymuthica]|jgi:hypothetical protein|uniref:Monooxygenase n=1 Tax=Serratia plymuthica TaxID=82996 RepID=A0A318P4F8_SERPL|nr:YdhR family protein [Serratia plymuthica]MEE4408067.1 YdhR family protein [Serratia sp. C2(2)]MEE4449647.1 YdhR family protein [Serratia sp. C2(1)]PYD36993.1 hypothetical protein CT690_21270 [Serratia plymuthica]
MIVAISTFSLLPNQSKKDIEAIFVNSAEEWAKNPHLISKQYFISPDLTHAGGIYYWKTMQDAKNWLGESYSKMILSSYGSIPQVTFYETSFFVDVPNKNITLK